MFAGIKVIVQSIYLSLAHSDHPNPNRMSLLSVVIPVYNEEINIPLIYNELKNIFTTLAIDFEVIYVDDGSTDGSLLVLRELSKKEARIKYISLSRNFGQQAALTAGMDHAKGDAVITMDCDMQDPPALIPEMIEKWKSGHDIIYARRKNRHDRFLKRITARWYYRLLTRFSDQKIQGEVGEFRLVDQKVIKELSMMREKSRYLRGMVYWLGFNYAIIDFERQNRQHGATGFNWLKMARLAMHGLLNFSLLPLRFGLFLGLLTIPAGLFFLIYFIFDIVVNHVEYPLYKWISVVSLIFIGFLFILIWILGEYIGKIYEETKDRPLYVIRFKGNLDP
jgi:dolichol-phosphate mannosyltransferase